MVLLCSVFLQVLSAPLPLCLCSVHSSMVATYHTTSMAMNLPIWILQLYSAHLQLKHRKVALVVPIENLLNKGSLAK